MNTITIANTALFAAGAAGVTAAIELAKAGNFVGAAISGVVGLAAILLYEKLPSSNT